MIRNLLIVVAVSASLSCRSIGASDDGQRSIIFEADSRETVLGAHASIVHVEITSREGPVEAVAQGTVFSANRWRARVLGQLTPRDLLPYPGENIRLTSGADRPPPNLSALPDVGQHYMVLWFQAVDPDGPGPFSLLAMFALGADDTLQEDVLGFPRGTPMSRIMDASTVRREFLSHVDGGAPGTHDASD